MPLTLHFQSFGSGPPLIILHGLFGSSNNWRTVAEKIGERFHVFAVDQRNHGSSPHSEEFSLPVLAEDLRGFMAVRGFSRASVLGHSMGGKVAMEFALRYPQMVDRLIIVDIAPRAYPPAHDGILEAMASLDLSAHSSRAGIEEALARRLTDTRVRQFVLTNLKRFAGGRYAWKINLDVLRRKHMEATKAQMSEVPFSRPVLFVRGERSAYLRDEDTNEIRLLFPAAIVRVIPEAGHWVHADRPEAFVQAVLEFLHG